MSTDNKTSILVKDQLPDFLNEEGPKFQAFMRAYYEWMEETGQATERSKNLLNYQDVDNTLDEFIKYFQREVLSEFPQEILADKRLVIKRIRDLYNSKGSEQSYKLLFKILYNDDADIFRPGPYILRASDGNWIREFSISLFPNFTGNIEDIIGETLTGEASGAYAEAVRSAGSFKFGLYFTDIYVINVSGNFQDGEFVSNANNTFRGQIFASRGSIESVAIITGGSGHRTGDNIDLITDSATSATGVVTRTLPRTLGVSVVDGGNGYVVGTPLTFTGGDGFDAAGEVASISDTETIQTYPDIIDYVANVAIYGDGSNSAFQDTGNVNPAATTELKTANVNTPVVDALGAINNTVGTISTITLTNPGTAYTVLPLVTAVNQPIAELRISAPDGGFKGENADFSVSLAGGAIAEVDVVNGGSGYVKNESLTIVNENLAGTSNATGTFSVTGLQTLPGYYKDTSGWLSSNRRLQDNYYWQEFSYEVQSTQFLSKYKEIVNKILHPSGTRLFGQYNNKATLNLSQFISIAPPEGITPLLFVDSDTFYAHTLELFLEPSLLDDSTDTFFSTTVTSNYPLTAPLFDDSADTFFSLTVTPGAVDLTPSLFDDSSDTFFSSTVTPGAVDLTPSLFDDSTDTFFNITVTSNYPLTASLFDDSTDTFFSATVTPGAVDLTPSLFDDSTDTFYSPSVETLLVLDADLTAVGTGAAGDQFGYSVAAWGNTAVVGAPFDDVSGNTDSGSVYVFFRNATQWVEQQHILPGDDRSDPNYGFSVAVSNNTLAFSGPKSRGIGNPTNRERGAISIYNRSGSTWSLYGEILGGGTTGDEFGYDVAMDNNILVVTARGLEQANVWIRSAGTWSGDAQLTASDQTTGDNFGHSVAISGNTAVIGAPNREVTGTDRGAAYVFFRNATSWVQQQILTASDASDNDQFGYSVDISDDTIIVGAPFNDVGANTEQGSAYIFTRTGSTWSQQQQIDANDGEADERFGLSVAVDGDVAYVGGNNVVGALRGDVYKFVRVGSTWEQTQQLSTVVTTETSMGTTSIATANGFIVAGQPLLGNGHIIIAK